MKKERTDRTREQPEHKLYDAVRARRLKDIQKLLFASSQKPASRQEEFFRAVYI